MQKLVRTASRDHSRTPLTIWTSIMKIANWPILTGVLAPLLVAGLLMAGSSWTSVRFNTAQAIVDRVAFPSADGRTTLEGYVFKPDLQAGARVPAVVMMHGRAGAYSTLANGVYDASTLAQRHQMWGRVWREQGYVAVMVDGFGPRGYPQGFGRFSYASRPPELDETKVRPLDALGALRYLQSRGDVLPDRIGLQGWSNGGSATLVTMATGSVVRQDRLPGDFRAALALYPACGLKDRFKGSGYGAYAPVRVFIGTADEEVSPRVCRALLEQAKGDVKIHFYDGATHGFDDPGRKRQRVPANAAARSDVIQRAAAFFATELGEQPVDAPSGLEWRGQNVWQ
jgi:dienelactone hydrolase